MPFDIKKIVNLTSKTVKIIDKKNNKIISFAPSGKVAHVRLETFKMPPMLFDGIEIPLASKEFGDVRGLPSETSPGMIFIVSKKVAEALPGRGDLVVPDDFVKDEDGKEIVCRRLILA